MTPQNRDRLIHSIWQDEDDALKSLLPPPPGQIHAHTSLTITRDLMTAILGVPPTNHRTFIVRTLWMYQRGKFQASEHHVYVKRSRRFQSVLNKRGRFAGSEYFLPQF